MAIRVKTASGTSIAIPADKEWIIKAATAKNTTGGTADLTFTTSGGIVFANNIGIDEFIAFVGQQQADVATRDDINLLAVVFHTTGNVTCNVPVTISYLERDVP